MNPRPLIINTIGYSGVDALTAELSRIPQLRILPGVNFIDFEGCLYRPHNYSQYSAEDVFASLNKDVITREGRLWAGTRRWMTPQESKEYSPTRHRELFLKRLPSGERSFIPVVRAYTDSFFESMGTSAGSAPAYWGFSGSNFVINLPHDIYVRENIAIIHFHNNIDTWLSQISQHMTWDCSESIKFWIASSLQARHVQRKHPQRFLWVSLEDYTKDPSRLMQRVSTFLGVESPRAESRTGFGHLQYNPKLIEKLLQDAPKMESIYGGTRHYEIARSFDSWADAFLDNPENGALMDKFQAYRESTYHTAFDFIGPLEEEIIRRISLIRNFDHKPSLSYQFYHQYNALSSDRYNKPQATLRHTLGSLESDIVLPELPYFLRISMEYFSHLLRIVRDQPHSYASVRKNPLYLKLQSPSAKTAIDRFRLQEPYQQLNDLTDEVDRVWTQFQKREIK